MVQIYWKWDKKQYGSTMKSRKKLVALLAVVVFGSGLWLLWIMYGPVLQDEEYDMALAWAESVQMPWIELAKNYPFSTITRAEAVSQYITLAQHIELLPVRSSCEFYDIDKETEATQKDIILACQYGFFSWSNKSFEPSSYLTKGTSLVALMRWILPAREFREEKEYWIPYIEAWNEMWITKREPWPYVNYLITRYELLLQLYRAYERKK